jgi:hypothetical protein
MSRESRYQQGKFENYDPERDQVRGDAFESGGRHEYEVRRKASGDVGGLHEPGGFGNHQGKGLRNYRRSDDRIVDEINDRLCDNPYIDASEVDIAISNGTVVLSGTVEDRQSKRLAEDIAESVSGVENVENALRIKKQGI